MRTLLVVDLQKGFHPPERIVRGIERIFPVYDHVILTKFVKKENSLFHRRLGMRKPYKWGSPESQFAVHPPKGTIILEKPSYGFRDKELKTVKKLGVKKIDICGVDTDACVLAVCFDLWDVGIVPVVLPELCASDGKLQKEALRIIRRNFKNPL